MIACLLLAAGRSSRFEGGHKLLAELEGRPVVAHAARALADADVGPLTVILGARADEVRTAIEREIDGTRFVVNADYAKGIGTSIAAGIAALPPEVEAVLVTLADMPRLAAADIRAVVAAHDRADPKAVTRAVPHGANRPGHPTVLGEGWFDGLAALTGDRGASSVLGRAEVKAVPVDAAGQVDVDTRGKLADLGGKSSAT